MKFELQLVLELEWASEEELWRRLVREDMGRVGKDCQGLVGLGGLVDAFD